jgi:Uma2 family endonuclease
MNLALAEIGLPIRIHPDRLMTDEELLHFCAQNEPMRIERDTNGELIIMSPTGNEGAAFDTDVTLDLGIWARQDGRGRVYNSNAGWNLPDGSMRAADAHWISWERLNSVADTQRKGFPSLCPEFVIEVRSESDRLEPLREKMTMWLANGAELAWLIDPSRKTVEIYRPGREPEVLEGGSAVEGEGPVAGFVLELGRIWT